MKDSALSKVSNLPKCFGGNHLFSGVSHFHKYIVAWSYGGSKANLRTCFLLGLSSAVDLYPGFCVLVDQSPGVVLSLKPCIFVFSFNKHAEEPGAQALGIRKIQLLSESRAFILE